MNSRILMNKQGDANQWHRMFLEHLGAHKMNRADYLNQLKKLPNILHKNMEIVQNASAPGKLELGILHLHQIASLYNTLQQSQYTQIPIQIKQIILGNKNTKEIQEHQRTKLIIQQMIDAENYEKYGQLQNKKFLSIFEHRLLCQNLMQMQPHRFKFDLILYKDQCLTQFQRCIYKIQPTIYEAIRNCRQKEKQVITQLIKFPQAGNMNSTGLSKNYVIQNQYHTQINGKQIIYKDNTKFLIQNYHQDLQNMNNEISQKTKRQNPVGFPLTQKMVEKITFIKNNNSEHNLAYVHKQNKIKKQRKNKKYTQIAKEIKPSIIRKKVSNKFNNQKLRKQRIKQIQEFDKQLDQVNDFEQKSSSENQQQYTIHKLAQNDSEEIRSIDKSNNQDENSEESQLLFLRQQRARIYKHAMTLKVKGGTRLFKHSSSLRWGNNKPLSQAEEAYALGRKQFVKQAHKYEQMKVNFRK